MGRYLQENTGGDFDYVRAKEGGLDAPFMSIYVPSEREQQKTAKQLADSLIDMVMGDTDLCPWDMGTFGSLSTRAFGPSLRAAGAEARAVLLELASEHLKMPAEKLTVENGVVFDKTNKKTRVSYGELTNGKKIERRVSGKVAVKKPSEFKIMGK